MRDTGPVLAGGTLTWKEGGTAHTALFAAAAIARSANLDLLQISGGESSGIGISFGIGVQPPPLAAGSYACGGAGYPIVSLSYSGGDATRLACTINLTSVGITAGTHTVGTFSASVGVTGESGTKMLTEGRFDIVPTVSSQ